ncbi:HAD family phosphatase [Candidatus Saccharibacteria bacterium]|nr:HAD family phosphatase [Candidatus Saccharibacteria bacterium]
MKKFAVFDIDGTLIRWQLYHAVVNRLAATGKLGDSSYDQIHAARFKWKERARSFRSYERVLMDKFVPLLSDLSASDYDRVIRDIWDEYRDQTYVYTRDLIKELKEQGYFLMAISGSPREIVALLAEYYGFDEFVACEFERRGDGFTGQVITPVLDKDKTLGKLVDEHGLTLAGSVAVGDSASDIAMLQMVERPIAFNPDQELFAAARRRGWPIVVERKDVVYNLSCRNGSYGEPSSCRNGSCKDSSQHLCKDGACKNGVSGDGKGRPRYELE